MSFIVDEYWQTQKLSPDDGTENQETKGPQKINEFSMDKLSELPKLIEVSRPGLASSLVVSGDKLQVRRTETDKGEAPTDDERDLWLAGDLALWRSTYSYYITETVVALVGKDRLSAMIMGKPEAEAVSQTLASIREELEGTS